MLPVRSTSRLVLAPMVIADADELVALDAGPEVMRFITGGRPSTPDAVLDTVSRECAHRWTARSRDGSFVGWFGLRPSDTVGATREIGYRLVRSSWGQGLAIEGAREVLAVAFDVLAVERVWGQTMTANTASRRVMERCGMRFVRTFHQDWGETVSGSELGDVEYEITVSRWRSAPNTG